MPARSSLPGGCCGSHRHLNEQVQGTARAGVVALEKATRNPGGAGETWGAGRIRKRAGAVGSGGELAGSGGDGGGRAAAVVGEREGRSGRPFATSSSREYLFPFPVNRFLLWSGITS